MRIGVLLLVCLVCGCVDQKKSGLNAWIFDTKLSGGMRLDRSPTDAPIDAALLADNFRKIAYDVEADPFATGDLIPEDQRTPMLKRWTREIRMKILTNSVAYSHARRQSYTFMHKLSALTGVRFKVSNDYKVSQKQEEPPNITMFLGDGPYFDGVLQSLDILSDSDDEQEATFANNLREFFEIWHGSYSPCAGRNYVGTSEEGGDTGEIDYAIVVIRTDLTEPMTRSCIEEELAQMMGLMNDDPDVRPSLFNDDLEFALLTTHDEFLLRILYDPRLKPGMTPEQSMPIVRRIASEMLPES